MSSITPSVVYPELDMLNNYGRSSSIPIYNMNDNLPEPQQLNSSSSASQLESKYNNPNNGKALTPENSPRNSCKSSKSKCTSECDECVIGDELINLHSELISIKSQLSLLHYTGSTDNNLLVPFQQAVNLLENQYKKDSIWCGRLKKNKIPKGQAIIEQLVHDIHQRVNGLLKRNESESEKNSVHQKLMPIYNALIEIRNNVARLRMSIVNQSEQALSDKNCYILQGEITHYQHILDELENENRDRNARIWGPKDSLINNTVLPGQAILNDILAKTYAMIEQIQEALENSNFNKLQLNENEDSKSVSSVNNDNTFDVYNSFELSLRDNRNQYILTAKVPPLFNYESLSVSISDKKFLTIRCNVTEHQVQDQYSRFKKTVEISKSLRLSNIVNNPSLITAKYDNACKLLTIQVPKVEVQSPASSKSSN